MFPYWSDVVVSNITYLNPCFFSIYVTWFNQSDLSLWFLLDNIAWSMMYYSWLPTSDWDLASSSMWVECSRPFLFYFLSLYHFSLEASWMDHNCCGSTCRQFCQPIRLTRFWFFLHFCSDFSSCFSNISPTSIHRSCAYCTLGLYATTLMYILLNFMSPFSLIDFQVSSIVSYYLHYSGSVGNMALSVIVLSLSWMLFAFNFFFTFRRYFPWLTGLFMRRFRAMGLLVDGVSDPKMYS